MLWPKYFLKKALLWLLIGAGVFFFPYGVWAAQRISVKTEILNVRSGPGTTFDKIGRIALGQEFLVIKREDDWFKVDLGDDRSGWVTAEYVDILPDEKPDRENSLPEKIVINGNLVNVRSGPGTNFAKITGLARGTAVSVLDFQNDWYQIKLSSGQIGWVAAWLVKPDEPTKVSNGEESIQATQIKQAIVNVETLNIRSEPNINSAKIGTFVYGTRLNIIGSADDWYQVSLGNGQKGWVAGWLVTLTNTAVSSWQYQAPTAPVFRMAADLSGDSKKQSLSWKWEKITSGVEVQIIGSQPLDFVLNKRKAEPGIVVELQGELDCNQEEQIGYGSVERVLATTGAGGTVIDIVLNQDVSYKTLLNRDGNVLSVEIPYSAVYGKTVVIDPGHGSIQPGNQWSDPGAIGPSGLREADVVLDIGQRLKVLLENQGARVVMSRTSDTNLSLEGRAKLANDLFADVFVSIHVNASPGESLWGTTTYFYAPPGTDIGMQRSARTNLAQCIQNRLIQRLERNNLGVREENFAVLRYTRVPSVLVETAFISNPVEEVLLADEGFRQQAALGIMEGLADFFNNTNNNSD